MQLLETAPSANLMAKKSKILTREQVFALPDPLPLGPVHKPVPHRQLIQTLEQTVGSFGFRIESERFSAMRTNGTFLFGVMVLAGQDSGLVVPGSKLALGFRSGNAQEKPVELVAGNRVVVCDNLLLAGDFIVMKKKHTTGLDLTAELTGGVERFLEESKKLVIDVEHWQNTPLEDDAARDFFFRAAIDEKVFPITRLPDVWENWINPRDPQNPRPDCEPRSLWGAHNAVTRAVRDSNLPGQFDVVSGLTRFVQNYSKN